MSFFVCIFKKNGLKTEMFCRNDKDCSMRVVAGYRKRLVEFVRPILKNKKILFNMDFLL